MCRSMMRTLAGWRGRHLLIPLATMLSGCSGDTPAPAPETALRLPVITITTTTQPREYEVAGNVVSDRRIEIASKISGYIQSIAVAEGDRVAAGDLLVQIDDSQVAAAITQARAALDTAQSALADAAADLARYEALLAQDSIPEAQVRKARLQRDAASGQVRAARAVLEQAGAQQQYTRITSPVDAVVIARQRRGGDLVAPGLPLLTLESPTGLLLETWIAEEWQGALAPGAPVRVTIDGIAAPLPGRLARIVPSGDPVSRRFAVKIALPEVPALLTLISIASFFPVSNLIDETVALLGRFAPPDVLRIITDQIKAISESQQGGILTFAFVLTVWSSSGAMVSIITTLNAAYDITEGRPWWKTRLTAIGLTVGVALFILTSISIVLVGPTFAEHLATSMHLGAAFKWTWLVLQWPVIFVLVVTGIGLVYYFAPDAEQEWVWVTPGSILATVLWVVVSLGFKAYISYFGNYNETYGTLGAFIMLLTWFYLSGLAILVGAEVNAEIEHASPYGKDVGEESTGREEEDRHAREALLRGQEGQGGTRSGTVRRRRELRPGSQGAARRLTTSFPSRRRDDVCRPSPSTPAPRAWAPAPSSDRARRRDRARHDRGPAARTQPPECRPERQPRPPAPAAARRGVRSR